MFDQVASLIHDLDMGMLPISVLAPYLPIAAHRRRDQCACRSAGCLQLMLTAVLVSTSRRAKLHSLSAACGQAACRHRHKRQQC